jgi:transcriptional regulator with GAF, ATPase, and Fis domain
MMGVFLSNNTIFIVLFDNDGLLVVKYDNQLNKRKRMDKNEFFREAALRVCGNLEIEKALFSTLQYLHAIIPVSWMALECYDKDLETMRTIAIANPNGGKSVDLITSLSAEAKMQAETKYDLKQRGVYLFEDPKKDKLSQEMLDFHGVEASSLIVLCLKSGDQMIGTLAMITEGDETFTQQHADLITLLSEPFAIALSNTLKHRNELKHQDRDFFWEITMRICGNLEIEKGLCDCITYLSQQMPADVIYLQRYEAELGAMRFIARANAEKGEQLDVMLSLPEMDKSAMSELSQGMAAGKHRPVMIYNDPVDDPISPHILNSLGEPASSVMVLPLSLEGEFAGALALLARGADRFSEDHARLYENLRVPFFVAMSNTLKHREILKLKDLLLDDNRFLHDELHRLSGDEIIGASFGLRDVMFKVQQVSSIDSPIILLGETGVGKDVIANAIHYSSSRSKGPFVSLNCGAIPETLIDSELFGHEKGAFTGALSKKRGRFERANKGTIFLDEIGELPPNAQVRLLRVIQNREIERVGGVKTIPVDIRIIAATNRNLEEMIKNKQFREDLWFRLNVFPIWIPPLRDRVSDIPELVQHFINLKSKELKLGHTPILAPGAIDILLGYNWPGNVRELENIIERAIILHHDEPLQFDIIGNTTKKTTARLYDRFKDKDTFPSFNSMIERHILQALELTDWKIHGPGGAAELLQLNPNTLRGKMRKMGIPFKK